MSSDEEREAALTLPGRRRGAVWHLLATLLVLAAVGTLPFGDSPVARAQQDAADATSAAAGANGTVNGVPRDSGDNVPAVVTGPGEPLAPSGVILPPNVTAPGVDPNLAGGVASTSDLGFNAVADTTVFLSDPRAGQTPESAALLAFGGPQSAVALISFDVSGIGDATVVSALLTFTGANSARGGPVDVIYGYTVSDGISANDVPSAEAALDFHGTPSWFDRVEQDGITSVDVTGAVQRDGAVTFVLPGQPEEQGLIYAMESGNSPTLSLTLAQPG
jgi:hypothetical protein